MFFQIGMKIAKMFQQSGIMIMIPKVGLVPSMQNLDCSSTVGIMTTTNSNPEDSVALVEVGFKEVTPQVTHIF